MKESLYRFLQNRPFARIGFFVFPVAFLIFIMGLYFPKTAPEEFKSFILAFEFAQTPEQIFTLLNDLPVEKLQDIDKGNYIDFALMLCYSTFLFTFFRKASIVFQKKWLKVGMLISVLALIADFLENIVLLQITRHFLAGEPLAALAPALQQLAIFTWFKWIALAVIFSIFAFGKFGKQAFTDIEGLIFLIPVCLIPYAIVGQSKGINIFATGIWVGFLMLFFFTFSYTNPVADVHQPTASAES